MPFLSAAALALTLLAVAPIAFAPLTGVAEAAAPKKAAPKPTAPKTAAPKPAAPKPAAAPATGDVAAARQLFETNLDAIRRKDRAGYLACYLDSPTMAKTGFEGMAVGYEGFEKGTDSWPDVFEAQDLQLTSLRPGLVYGTYRYRVRYGGDEHVGLSERFFLKTEKGWRIAVTTAFDAPAGTPPPPRALVGATLLDGTGGAPVPRAVVLMRGGRIECAGAAADCPVPEGVGRIDVKGKFITPGIVDAHVHFSQTGWADGRPDALDLRATHPYDATEADLRAHPERWFNAYLCSGVTAVFDVGGYSWTLGLRARAEDDTGAPHVSAAGPLLSTLDHWLNLPGDKQLMYVTDEATARGMVDYLASLGSEAIKIWFIPPPDAEFDAKAAAVRAAGDEAKKKGVPVIVHATELREAKTALAAGARLLVHSVWDQPVDDEFIALAKQNGAIYCPTITVSGGYQRMFAAAASGQPPAIDDPNGCVDAKTRTLVASTPTEGAGKMDAATVARISERNAAQLKTMNENLMKVFKAGIPVAMGTDAGNPLTLHGPSVYAEMEAMQAAGMTPLEVLTASSRGGALAMRRDADFGTIEKGKIADLLVVTADPSADIANLRRLEYVVRGGVVRALGE
ncbi:MAG TPA: amidohydrolase family protein, partial [Candidatus Polarisedimenticolia bacterium]|nr:amidohydrolase family protein [Candidatus Polarisedimenticolia bacterium]